MSLDELSTELKSYEHDHDHMEGEEEDESHTMLTDDEIATIFSDADVNMDGLLSYYEI